MLPDIPSSPELAVIFQSVGKRYDVRFSHRSLSGRFFLGNAPRAENREIWAVRQVSFAVRRGETVGIIGENGSGKSTLLRLINRVTFPSQGRVSVQGRVAGLLDLGGGFHPELTGLENIELAASLYGMSALEIQERLPQIVAFTGLERFIDAPLKTYSQGMLVRLGFSVAVFVQSDIFLIDDSLAVGDEEFQRKCLRQIAALREQGRTIIVVSHDVHALSRICSRGLLIHGGRLIKDDLFAKVMVRYHESVGERASVASLDCGLLSVIFNAGRVLMLWDGVLLTKQYGGYVSVLVKDRWLFAHEALWRVEQTSARRITAQGKWLAAGIDIRVVLTLAGERSVREEIEIILNGEVPVEKVICGLMLGEMYNRYFDGEELLPVPPCGEYSWQDVHRGDDFSLPLVVAGPESCPAVSASFDIPRRSWFTLIQNTDAEVNAKVLQAHLGLSAADSLPRRDVVRLTADIELKQPGELEALLSQQRQLRRVDAAGLTLVLRQDRLELCSAQTRLTMPAGIQFFTAHDRRRRNMLDVAHSIRPGEAGSVTIIPRGEDAAYDQMTFTPVWGGIEWEVAGRQDRIVPGESLIMQMNLVPQYTAFLTESDCRQYGTPGETQERVIPELDQGFIAVLSADPAYAPVGVECAVAMRLGVFNAAGAGRLVEISWPAGTRASGILRTGADAHAMQDHRSAYLQRRRDQRSLSQGDLRLEVEDAQVHMYWRNTRVSAGPGLTTNIFLNDRWHQAPLGHAQCLKIGQRLQVRIPRTIPLLQETWEIEADLRGFVWNVSVAAEESTVPVMIRACLHVDPAFDHWFTPRQAQSFADGPPGAMGPDAAEGFLGVCAPEDRFPRIVMNTRGYDQAVIEAQGDAEGHTLAFVRNGIPANAAGNDIFSLRVDCVASTAGLLLPILAATQAPVRIFPRAVELQAFPHALLSGEGMRIVCEGAWGSVDSGRARWSITQQGEAQIRALLRWEGVSWQCCLSARQENQSIVLRVTALVQEPLAMDRMVISFILAKDTTWTNDQLWPRLISGPEFPSLQGEAFICTRWIAGVEAVSSGMRIETEPECWLAHESARESGSHVIDLRRIAPPGESVVLRPGEHTVFSCRWEMVRYADQARERLAKLQEGAFAVLKSRMWYAQSRAGIAQVYRHESPEASEPLCAVLSGIGDDEQWFFSPAAGWQAAPRRQEVKAQLFWNAIVTSQEWHMRCSERSELVMTVRTLRPENSRMSAVILVILNPEISWWHVGDEGSPGPQEFPATLAFQDIRHAQTNADEVQVGKSGMPAALLVTGSSENGAGILCVESDRWGRRVLKYLSRAREPGIELIQTLRMRVAG